MKNGTEHKIATRKYLQEIVAQLRAAGKKIGFTSGTFDLLHPGHVAYLEQAAAECDVLIVGVNSDHSVRSYKGEGRPICPEVDRARVVAGLAVVDYVFIFDETNNAANIEALRPELYIKAGDYSKQRLTSSAAVEAYGGKVLIVSFKEGRSSSAIVERIVNNPSIPRTSATPSVAKRPAIFLDRDGTINEEIEYLHEPEKFRMLPNVLQGMKRFQELGYRLVVITNQAGIGLGYFTKEDFFRVNREMLKAVTAEGIFIDGIYFCPHRINEGCSCRKPLPGMINRAARDLNLDLSKSFVVGDSQVDVDAATAAGCPAIVIQSNKTLDLSRSVGASKPVADLLEAANAVGAYGKKD